MSDDGYKEDDLEVLRGMVLRKTEPVHPEMVTCVRCRWVSYAVSKEDAENEIRKFNEYYEGLPDNEKSYYGGPSSLDKYRCLRCGGTEFRQTEEGECPYGATLNPVVCDEFARP